MRPTVLACLLAAGCTGGSDPGGGDDGGPAGGAAWTGTATAHLVDLAGNVDDLTAEVTWVEGAVDEDGVDYLPTGTVTIARTVPGCTVTFEPASHAIDTATDGLLRVDRTTYRGGAGTSWQATVTMACPPSAPLTLPSVVAAGWLTSPAARPLAAPDLITGHDVDGPSERAWTFHRTPPP